MNSRNRDARIGRLYISVAMASAIGGTFSIVLIPGMNTMNCVPTITEVIATDELNTSVSHNSPTDYASNKFIDSESLWDNLPKIGKGE